MNNSKNIWIVNYYSSPPEFATNTRHLEFSNHLQEYGHRVTIMSSSYLNRQKINLIQDKKKYIAKFYGNHFFIHFKTNSYSGNGIRRMFSIFHFALQIFFSRKKFEKPDLIIHNIHVPFDFPIYWCAKKLKAKYIAEAWDLWPDNFVTYGLISKNNPLLRLAYKIEYFIYKKADSIIFTFEGGIDYLKKMKWTSDKGGKINPHKVKYINNGINNEEFELNKKKFPLSDPDLTNPNTFKIIYVGSINLVNNLKTLIDAANLLQATNNIKFLIYGDGIDRNFLQSYCTSNNILNVLFKERWIELKYIPYIVSCSSLNILNYQSNFGMYGISSGKFFQYLAAAKPICSNIATNYCEITKNKLGISSNLFSPEQYAEAIFKIYNLPSEEYQSMCKRVSETSRKFDYKIHSIALIKIIDSLCTD